MNGFEVFLLVVGCCAAYGFMMFYTAVRYWKLALKRWIVDCGTREGHGFATAFIGLLWPVGLPIYWALLLAQYSAADGFRNVIKGSEERKQAKHDRELALKREDRLRVEADTRYLEANKVNARVTVPESSE